MQSTVVNFMSRGFKENTKLYLNKKYCFFSWVSPFFSIHEMLCKKFSQLPCECCSLI
jgi:hypothetical protein